MGAAPERFPPATVDLVARDILGETRMKILLAAAAASTLLLIPVGASAQRSQQTTETQQTFRDSVKAERPSLKRHRILRSESNRNSTTGVGPIER
jgi:hypothetical protein